MHCTVLYCTVLYCTVLYPRAVQAAISPAGSYYFYAAVAVAAALLGLTVLPETKVRHSNLYNTINFTCLLKYLGQEPGRGVPIFLRVLHLGPR